MATDLTLSGEEIVLSLLNTANATSLSLDVVDLGEPSILTSPPANKNTELAVVSKPNRRYTGSVSITYNRLDINNLSNDIELSVNANRDTPWVSVIALINDKYDINLADKDYSQNITFTVPYLTTRHTTLTINPLSLKYFGEVDVIINVPPVAVANKTTSTAGPTPLAYASSTLLGPELYILGGLTSEGVKDSTTRVYNFNLDVWLDVGAHPFGHGGQACSHETGIYGGSGWVAAGYTIGIFKFNPWPSYTWTLIAEFPYGKLVDDIYHLAYYSVAITEDGRYLHVMGGTAPGSPHVNTDDHYRYDIINDVWESLASLPVALWLASALWFDGKLYLAGGGLENPLVTALDTLYCYDPIANSWSELASMPHATAGARLHRIGRELIMYSGSKSDWSALQVLQIYDIDTDSWTEQSVASFDGRMCYASGIYQDKLYVWGGDSHFNETDPVSGMIQIG